MRVGHEPLSLTVRIRGNPKRLALELRGLLRSDFPVRVRPVDLDVVAGVDGELEFLGPFHWQRPIESIAAPDRRVHLLVLGRNAHWLGATPIDAQGDRAVVNLVPARRLDFFWIDGPPAGRGLSLAVAGESVPTSATSLARRLIPAGGPERPGWQATLVVPRTAFALECADREGLGLWSTRVAAGESNAVITLQGLEARVIRGS